MGLTVRLVNNLGEILDEVVARHGVLDALVGGIANNEAYHQLRYVDLYGYTVFNGVQMQPLLRDLKRLREEALIGEEIRLIEDIDRLARRCQNQAHEYLQFIGD